MSTKSELDKLIRGARNTIFKYKQTITDCNDKIDRLKLVYDELTDIKDSFRKARKETQKTFLEKGTWKGEKYTSFCNDGDAVDSACQEYYTRLDIAHDAINTKIGELRATKRRLTPLIGGLWGDIAKWEAEIKNLVN